MYRLTTVLSLLAIALAAPLAAAEEQAENVAPFFITGDLTISAATEDEDDVYPEAQLPTVVGPLITDYDPVGLTLMPARGIAVVGSEIDSPVGGTGTWWYNDPATGDWLQIPEVSEENAFLMPFTVEIGETPTAVQIRFIPDSHFNGTAALIVRAWDGTDGYADFFIYDPETPEVPPVSTRNTADFPPSFYGGSPTAFSSETRRLEVTVDPVNDAPSLSPVTTDLQPFPRRAAASAHVKTLISDLMGTQEDADGEPIGLAIASTYGFTLAYSLDPAISADAGGWIPFPSRAAAVLCLPQSAAIRVTPSGSDTAGGTAFTAYAWDGGGTLDVDRLAVLADLQTDERVSAGSANFDQPVTNTPPTWIHAPSSLDSIYLPTPAATDTSEAQLSDLILVDGSEAFSDANADPAGIAIVASSGAGTWWVGTDNEGYIDWVALGAPADDNVVLVSGDQYLKYEPDPYSGNETAELTVRAWDQTGFPTDLTGADDPEGSVSIGEDASRTISVDVTINQAPTVDGLPDGVVTALVGITTELSLTVDDEDSANVTWQVTSTLGGSLASEGTASGGSYNLRFTPNADDPTGSVTFTVTDADGLSNEYTVDFANVSNHPPVIGTLPGTTTAIAGRPTGVDLTATDDGDVDALTWSVVGYAVGGTASFSDPSGPIARLQFTPDGESSTGSVTFIVTDDLEAPSVAQTVYFTIEANETPLIVSAAPGTVAVAGQPWEALVTVTDGNAGDTDNLTRSGGPSETWISLQDLGGGRYRFYGTPGNSDIGNTSDFSTTFSDPSNASDSLNFSVTTVAGEAITVTGPSVPVSAAGSIVYGAIHPGSSSNLASLSSQVVGLGQAQARAFWWSASSGAFRELPNMPGSPATAGIFLASLSAVTVTYNAPPQAAPYAITLPAQSWSFIGIPPIYTDASTVTQAHAWNDFRLESTDGVPVDVEADVADILGNGTMASTRPWLWNGTSYAQVDTLNTGTAYWIRNRSSSSAYRLVRATSGAAATFGDFHNGGQRGGLAVLARTASASAVSSTTTADQPPAPPGSLSAPASSSSADGGGGSCGSGGLAGLLIAGLALLGLRPRRRT